MLSVEADCAKKQSCDDAKMLSGDEKRGSEGPVKRSTDKASDMGAKLGPTYGLVKPVQSVSGGSWLS